MDKVKFYDCLVFRDNTGRDLCFELLKNVDNILYGVKTDGLFEFMKYDENYEILRKSRTPFKFDVVNIYHEYSEKNADICDGHTKDTQRMTKNDNSRHTMLINIPIDSLDGIWEKERFYVEKIDLIKECREYNAHACAILTNRYFKERERID